MVTKLSEKQVKNHDITAKALAGIKDGTYKTAYEASKETGAPLRTLYKRLNGQKSLQESRASRQLLSPNEEQALVGWVLCAAATGHSVTHSFLHELAEEIRKPQVTPDSSNNISVPLLGQDWIKQFMHHNPQLKTAMA